jgi:hypothetical protein
MTKTLVEFPANLDELERLTTQLPVWIARGSVLGLIAALGAVLVYLMLMPRSETLEVHLIIRADPTTRLSDGPGSADNVVTAPLDTVLTATGLLPASAAGRVKPGVPVRLVRSGLADTRDRSMVGEVRTISLISPECGYRLTVTVAAGSTAGDAAFTRNGSAATGYLALGERRVLSIIFSGLMHRLGWQG